MISVQYKVVEASVADAHYKLTRPKTHITAYVEDVIRGAISTKTLDEAFSSKENLAHAVKDQLSLEMKDFGALQCNLKAMIATLPESLISADRNKSNDPHPTRCEPYVDRRS